MSWTDPHDGLPVRHARVWLDPATPVVDGALRGWIAQGRALVATRRDPSIAAHCALGVALPLDRDRRRIALVVEPRAILRVAPPLTLDAIDDAPTTWRPALSDLHDRMERQGGVFHVYGSLAWQAISGEPCVRADSDVDLLWTAGDVAQVERVLRLLEDWQRDTGLRADGELLLPRGDAVAWREIGSASDRILVKHRDRVSLQPWPACWWDPYRDVVAHAA